MFTGIIKAIGTIRGLERRGGDVRLSVRSDGLPWSDYEIGESIAVNGVCLTAVALHRDGFDTDVSVETLDVMQAIDAINAIVPDQKIHACGYCLGGTMLSIADLTHHHPDGTLALHDLSFALDEGMTDEDGWDSSNGELEFTKIEGDRYEGRFGAKATRRDGSDPIEVSGTFVAYERPKKKKK